MKEFHVVALARRYDERSLLEKVVVLGPTGTPFTNYTLVSQMQVGSPFVVWRRGPGRLTEFETGRAVDLAHDAVIYEKMESTSTAFYLEGNVFRSLLVTD